VKQDLAHDGIHDVLLASPTAVAGLLNIARIPDRARVITIGPTTSAAARNTGLAVSAEARRPTFEAMLEAMS
jgi:uroporphyrinogen-III synthase